ncbi:MAG: glycoside hydrolase family 28 protein [Anaeroplasma bactoclasticum]|nr:glycoside hydrolase family 28 protein [Anaeroplasma bactoclasticum]MCM1195933.1 glycoside hydrolase family 28 protein [Roseburia sp.]MCM1514779.1 glycoside hydrolase family 28 protein [Anaeroplasma bactoclasticum]MCM1556579.1 glycoside hydrolase family 28 protein [Anaeroplasma bactoclasticum]
MFDIIFQSSTSVTIELQNKEVYNTSPYNIYMNNICVAENITTNVYSIYNLKPSTKYEISINGVVKTFTTDYEYVCLNVKDFGAKGDGKSIDTNFIQACIYACPNQGRVYFPAGEYYTGPILLRSNITIELDENARLIGDVDRSHYPVLPGMIYTSDEKDEYNLGSWEGNPLDCFASIITGINVENIKIIGKGIIDGNAQNADWWVDVRTKRIAWRPRGVFLNHCKNVSFQGVMVTNTPSWNLHPYFSEEIRFIDMRLVSPKNSPNTDGCDPESCDKVDIIGVYFSVGDDCIAIKSGKIFMGRKFKKPSSNFNIRNCSMNFGHGAVVLGSEMSGGIKNINVSQCLFNQTDRGLRIKTRRGRGKDAIIDGIKFENIKMDNVLTPLVINMFYYCDPDGHSKYVYTKEKLPIDDRTPYLGKFEFKNIECNNVNVAAGTFYGLPEAPIESILIENIKFNYACNTVEAIPAMMDFLEPMSGEGLIFNYVNSVTIKNVSFSNFKKEKVVKKFVNQYKEI